MKFYITVEGTPRLKRSFINLKLFQIINIPDVLEQHGYTIDTIDDYGSFIVTTKILSLIKNYSKSKRIRGIIYSNPSINDEIITNLMEIVSQFEKIEETVLLDDYYVPKLNNLYSQFNEIIFFPSVKKIRLIECKGVTHPIDWNKNI
jgi:hypothetical protein